MDKFMEI